MGSKACRSVNRAQRTDFVQNCSAQVVLPAVQGPPLSTKPGQSRDPQQPLAAVDTPGSAQAQLRVQTSGSHFWKCSQRWERRRRTGIPPPSSSWGSGA